MRGLVCTGRGFLHSRRRLAVCLNPEGESIAEGAGAGRVWSGADAGLRYDAFGNQTQTISYAGYASVGAQAGNKFDGPGGGSAARTTTISYENFFNAFPTVRQRPTVNGVTLTEDAAYDFRLGVVTSVHDPAYNLTSATYDPFGRLKTLVKPFDSAGVPTASATYYDWDFPIRSIVSRQEVAGNAGATRPTITFYDGVGRKLQTKRETVDGLQTAVQNWYYDGLDRVRQWTQPRYHNASASGNGEFWGYTTVGQGDQPIANFLATFDALGRPRTTTTPQPDNKTTTTTYYPATVGTAASTVDANGHKTRRETDLFGRLRAVLEYSGSADTGADPYALYATTTYAYDPRDLLTSATDAQGNVATMAYDGLGRKTAMHDPDMGNWAYPYNPDGTLATQTDAKGQVTNFAYDALGRLTSRATPADGRTATYAYDDTAGSNPGQDHLTAQSLLVNGTVTNKISFFYDVRGRVIRRYTWTATLAATRTIQYAYDSGDRLTSVTYPGGEVVTAGYDAGWRQASLCSTTYGVCYATGATYNALDEPTAWTFGNGLVQANTYDVLGRATGLTVGGGVLSRGYTYDPVGNVATATDTVLGQTQTFAYDHRDRLTRGWTTGSATAAYDESYTYNAIGNLTAKGPTGGLAAYTYPASGASSVRPHAVTSVGAAAYGYDADGNMSSRAGKTLTWNADNTLASLTGPDNVQESYTYDTDGQRLTRQRLIPLPNGVTTVYAGGVWEEDTPGGTTRSLYQFAGKTIAQRTVVASPASNTVAYLHADALGSSSASTNSAGAVTAQQRYTPFGAVRQAVVADPVLFPELLREVLRHDPPVQNTRRFVAEAGTIAGQEVRPGDAILVLLAAANRDPAANPQPDRFLLSRPGCRSFTFGVGLHGCPGDALAVTIARAAIAQILASGHDLGQFAGPATYHPAANLRIPLTRGPPA